MDIRWKNVINVMGKDILSFHAWNVMVMGGIIAFHAKAPEGTIAFHAAVKVKESVMNAMETE